MTRIAFIGFGEAGRAFAKKGDWAFDRKWGQPDGARAKQQDCAAKGVTGCDSAATALADADAIISVVTADQALPAAQEYAPNIKAGSLWLDCNSVAPETKRAAARVIEGAGGRYVDVAVMAPVDPAFLGVPLLVAGPHEEAAIALLKAHGFRNISPAGANVGDASGIKMIRSVMVKGLEALTAECVCAAERAGVLDAVLQSLDASPPPPQWAERADYNFDRMLVHGTRRAAEMEEAAKTLSDLGIEPAMTRGTIQHQRSLGALGITPPDGLQAKLAALAAHRKNHKEG